MSEKEGKTRKGGSLGPVRAVVLAAALCVFLYSGFRLYTILTDYRNAEEEYTEIAEEFTTALEPAAKQEEASSSREEAESGKKPASAPEKDGKAGEEEEQMLVEDAEPPLSVNWEELDIVNPDIVGWIYVDGLTTINYPVCQSSDNDFYLHRTFRQQPLYAGSIFEDYHNNSDFADPNTIVYGHNMRNGSMFGTLKNLKSQEAYDANPYFWILTPEGNYRYHIFSIFTTEVDSDVYMLYGTGSEEFLKWEKKMQALSEVKNDVPLSKRDNTVVLSTCTSNSAARNVVIGKCVSSDRPVHREEKLMIAEEALKSAVRTSLNASVDAIAGVEIPEHLIHPETAGAEDAAG